MRLVFWDAREEELVGVWYLLWMSWVEVPFRDKHAIHVTYVAHSWNRYQSFMIKRCNEETYMIPSNHSLDILWQNMIRLNAGS